MLEVMQLAFEQLEKLEKGPRAPQARTLRSGWRWLTRRLPWYWNLSRADSAAAGSLGQPADGHGDPATGKTAHPRLALYYLSRFSVRWLCLCLDTSD